jgi:hypothetical protein
VELVVLQDIPNPRDVVSILNKAVTDARLIAQERSNTHHYSSRNLTVSTSLDEGSPRTADARTTDPIEQLRKLGELRDLGIVTEEEFATKKAEILSRL